MQLVAPWLFMDQDESSVGERKPAAIVGDGDISSDRINIESKPQTKGKSAKARPGGNGRKGYRKPKDRPKRPMSAYNIFFKEQREKLIAERETLASEKGDNLRTGSQFFSHLGKTIGRRWKDLPAEERSRFEHMAKLELEKYRETMKKYFANKEKEEVRGAADEKDTGDWQSKARVPTNQPTSPSSSMLNSPSTQRPQLPNLTSLLQHRSPEQPVAVPGHLSGLLRSSQDMAANVMLPPQVTMDHDAIYGQNPFLGSDMAAYLPSIGQQERMQQLKAMNHGQLLSGSTRGSDWLTSSVHAHASVSARLQQEHRQRAELLDIINATHQGNLPLIPHHQGFSQQALLAYFQGPGTQLRAIGDHGTGLPSQWPLTLQQGAHGVGFLPDAQGSPPVSDEALARLIAALRGTSHDGQQPRAPTAEDGKFYNNRQG